MSMKKWSGYKMIRYLKFKLKYLYGDLQRKWVNFSIPKEDGSKDMSFYRSDTEGWSLVYD